MDEEPCKTSFPSESKQEILGQMTLARAPLSERLAAAGQQAVEGRVKWQTS
jgi:hypothetical protein